MHCNAFFWEPIDARLQNYNICAIVGGANMCARAQKKETLWLIYTHVSMAYALALAVALGAGMWTTIISPFAIFLVLTIVGTVTVASPNFTSFADIFAFRFMPSLLSARVTQKNGQHTFTTSSFTPGKAGGQDLEVRGAERRTLHLDVVRITLAIGSFDLGETGAKSEDFQVADMTLHFVAHRLPFRCRVGGARDVAAGHTATFR